MRSIGKRNIRLVKGITKTEYERTNRNSYLWSSILHNNVVALIPEKIFDTWEMSYQEIDGIIDDYVLELENGR